MKIAVFGAKGGIGSQVVKYALEKGYDVVAFINEAISEGLSRYIHKMPIIGS